MSITTRALIVAGFLLVTRGYLDRTSRAEPTRVRATLETLPYEIGEWQGTREPDFDAGVRSLLGVDDYALRAYSSGGRPPVGLYVGYYGSQRQGDTVHSPLNCLPGAGWIPTDVGRRTLSVTDQGRPRTVEVNRVVIQKGLDRQLVLYWYQSHGRVVASEYWGKVYLVADAIRLNRTDGALVRVIVPIREEGPEGEAVAERAAADFTGGLFPLLGRYLPS